MVNNTIDCTKGETSMTDMQTKIMVASIVDIFVTSQSLIEAYERFKRITNAADILLEKDSAAQELNMQRQTFQPGETGMTDYQFNRFVELWDKCDALTREAKMLREENLKLKDEINQLESLTPKH